MKLYQILVKYNQDKKIIDFLLIKKGYSIAALLFGVFWFSYQAMWFQTLALLIFHLILLKIENNNITLFYSIAVSFIIFYYANDWLIADLIENKKYEVTEYIEGHYSYIGHDANIMKNPIWRVKENNGTF